MLCEKNTDTEQFNQSVKDTEIGSMLKFYQALDVDQSEFDTALQSEWFMPNSYKNINIEHMNPKIHLNTKIKLANYMGKISISTYIISIDTISNMIYQNIMINIMFHLDLI